MFWDTCNPLIIQDWVPKQDLVFPALGTKEDRQMCLFYQLQTSEKRKSRAHSPGQWTWPVLTNTAHWPLISSRGYCLTLTAIDTFPDMTQQFLCTADMNHTNQVLLNGWCLHIQSDNGATLKAKDTQYCAISWGRPWMFYDPHDAQAATSNFIAS